MNNHNEVFTPIEPASKQELIREIVSQIFSNQDHRLKTNLTERQVLALTRLMIFAERYDSTTARNLEEFITDYVVSIRAMGRRDLRDALKAVLLQSGMELPDERKDRRLIARLLGG